MIEFYKDCSFESSSFDWISFLVGIVALLVSFFAARFQIYSMILTQLSERARECNSHLEYGQIKHYSGVLGGVITANQIKDHFFTKKFFCFWLISEQSVVDNFYLQLDTSIRIMYFSNSENIMKELNKLEGESKRVAHDQFLNGKRFLHKSFDKFL